MLVLCVFEHATTFSLIAHGIMCALCPDAHVLYLVGHRHTLFGKILEPSNAFWTLKLCEIVVVFAIIFRSVFSFIILFVFLCVLVSPIVRERTSAANMNRECETEKEKKYIIK